MHLPLKCTTTRFSYDSRPTSLRPRQSRWRPALLKIPSVSRFICWTESSECGPSKSVTTVMSAAHAANMGRRQRSKRGISHLGEQGPIYGFIVVDSPRCGGSGGRAQAQMLSERFEIPVIMQKVVAVLDAPRRNHRIDGLSDGHATPAQRAKIPGGLDRDVLAAQFHNRKRGQHSPGPLKIPLVLEALQDLGKNQVADWQGLL